MNSEAYKKYLNAKDFGATGSLFETSAVVVAGSNEIIVDDVGDFAVGQEVLLTRGFQRHVCDIFSDRKDTSPVNRRPWQHGRPLNGRLELLGSADEEWVAYFVDFDPTTPQVLRWSKDFGRTWHENVPVTEEPIDLDGKVSVKVNAFPEREWGVTAVVVCSTRLIAVIEKIEGNKIYLSKTANESAGCVLRHSDTLPIQNAINAAIAEGKGVYLPNGRYRLTSTLFIQGHTSFTFEGESGYGTILDNSLGAFGLEKPDGSCFAVEGGKEFTLRNIFMIGGGGFAERDQYGLLPVKGGTAIFGFYYNKSNATYIYNTERVYIENCHARRMSAECFFALSDKRRPPNPDPELYNTSIIYNRCTVEDCARNAFNTAAQAENTAMLYCRVRDVGNAAFEGASRFSRIEGCYFRNTGPLEFGNSRTRGEFHELLPTGQVVISGNHFESGCSTGTAMIRCGAAATQILITGNNFVNLNTNVIDSYGGGTIYDLPSENTLITSNIFDMTAAESESQERYAIKITNNFVTIADNQIYVRGERDSKVLGIKISDDVTRVQIHDNTFAGIDTGICSARVYGSIGLVESDRVFYRTEPSQVHSQYKPMLLRRRSHGYRGWTIRWLADGSESEIESFNAETLAFTLKEGREMKVGDEFMIYSTVSTPWNIHDNLFDNCREAMNLDTEVGAQAIVRDNIIG